MCEEIKKKAQDAELKPEEIIEVAGGSFSGTYTCPCCGEVFEHADTLLVQMDMKWHMAKHMVP